MHVVPAVPIIVEPESGEILAPREHEPVAVAAPRAGEFRVGIPPVKDFTAAGHIVAVSLHHVTRPIEQRGHTTENFVVVMQVARGRAILITTEPRRRSVTDRTVRG